MHVGALRGADHGRGIHLAQARDVLGHGACEQLHVLRQVTDVRPQVLARPGGDIGPVQPDRAGVRLPDPEDQARQGGLARGARPDDAERFARRQHERDAADDGFLGAAQAEHHALDRDLALRRGQFGARHGRRIARQQLRKAAPGGARLHQVAPVGDQRLHRRKGPAEDQRRGEHHARRHVLVHHQPGAGADHRDLNRLAREPGEARERAAQRARLRLLAQHRVVDRGPAPRHRGQHAKRAHHLGVARARVDVAARAPGSRLHLLERLAREALVENRDHDHHQRTGQRHGAEQRVKEEDQHQEQRQPGRIEERKDARAGEKAAQGVDIAQAVHIFRAGEPRRMRKHAIEHARPQLTVHRPAAGREQPRAQAFDQRHHQQRRHHHQGKHRQGLFAAAGNDPVEDLQHVRRRRQHQHIDGEAEQRRVDEERPETENQVAQRLTATMGNRAL